MYTTCHLCPKDEKPVKVDRHIVEAIGRYLEPEIVENLVILDVDGETEVLEKTHCSLAQAIDLWAGYEPVHSYFAYGKCAPVQQLLEEIERTIPETAAGYMPWSPMLSTGPTELRDIDDDDVTIARTNIELTLSGDGLPKDCDSFLSRFENLTYSQQIKQFMERITERSWRWLMTSG